MLRIDTIVGNPPYNRGMDLDFMYKQFESTQKYTLMIVPAKWQTQQGEQRVKSDISYEKFRTDIVPYMKDVVFYPYCRDIFDIMQVDGISYYLTDDEIHKVKRIRNIQKQFKQLNSIEYRDISNREQLLNAGNSLIEYIKPYKPFEFMTVTNTLKYKVRINDKTPGGGMQAIENNRKALFVGACSIETEENKDAQPQSKIVFESNSLEECEQFISWISTTFVQFCLAINQSKLTCVLNNDNYRFVPQLDCEKYDHIFTDAEMYMKYNLTANQIDIIEQMVQSRLRKSN